MKISEMNQPDSVPSNDTQTVEENNKENSRPNQDDDDEEEQEEQEAAQIIPWRAQLRKTNSKLSLLDWKYSSASELLNHPGF